MIWRLFSPIKLYLNIENKIFVPGETINGEIVLKIKKSSYLNFLQVSLLKSLGIPSSRGFIELDISKNKEKNSPKIKMMNKSNSQQMIYENAKINRIETRSYEILVDKEILKNKKLNPTKDELILPIKIKIPEEIFDNENLASNMIIPPQLKDKLDKITKTIPILLKVRLNFNEGKNITKSIYLKVSRG